MSSVADRPIAKLFKSKEAKAWLKKHAPSEPLLSGGLNSCLPYNSFTKILSYSRKAAVDAITEVLEDFNARDRELADLFLVMPPRQIAKQLGLKRSVLYDRLRALRAKAFKMAARKRASYVNQRAGDLKLDTSPDLCALRVLRLALNEETRFAYLIQRDDEQLWVDGVGAVFGADVQDVLNNADEDLAHCEVLDVEAV